MIFTFKAAATAIAYLGRSTAGASCPAKRIGMAEVFVMPGPMEERSSAQRKIDDLRSWVS